MYAPEDGRNPQYPVFARIDGRIIPFLSLRCVVAVAVSLAIAAVLWAASGMVVHEAEVDLTPSESSEARAEAKAQLYAVRLAALEEAIEPYVGDDGEPDPSIGEDGLAELRELQSQRDSMAALLADYGPDERAELAEAGRAAGMGAGMDETDIEAFVPETRVSVEPVLTRPARFALFVICPVATAIVMFGEFGGGMSIASYIGDAVSFRRRRREFEYCKYCEEGGCR